MAIKRRGWLLNVIVASGWLLLVASFGIALTPNNVAMAQDGYGKAAMMWLVISGISWLGARQSRLTNADVSKKKSG